MKYLLGNIIKTPLIIKSRMDTDINFNHNETKLKINDNP